MFAWRKRLDYDGCCTARPEERTTASHAAGMQGGPTDPKWLGCVWGSGQMGNHVAASQFEHLFWLRIMKDHSEFLSDALPCGAMDLRRQADCFAREFEGLLRLAQDLGDSHDHKWMSFAAEVQSAVEDFGTFKLNLLSMMLRREIVLDLTPTFVNHMVNELEDYLMILHFLSKGQEPITKNPVSLHLLWLKDSQGHAEYLACGLDYTEHDLIEEARHFAEIFLIQHSEAIEYRGFLRTCLELFPSLQRFDSRAADSTRDFCDYLGNLRDLLRDARAKGALQIPVIDHMMRESCYYLHKLHRADPTSVAEPDCDPAGCPAE